MKQHGTLFTYRYPHPATSEESMSTVKPGDQMSTNHLSLTFYNTPALHNSKIHFRLENNRNSSKNTVCGNLAL